jgi:hypothetical protein
MGWEYASGADMSAYKYLVINLAATSSGSHLNIYNENSIWSACHATPDFGSKKQIVVNLKTAKYTSDGDKKGQKINTKNIRIVAFWGNGSQNIKVEDIYLTNNDDYTPTAIENAIVDVRNTPAVIYDLQGRKVASPLKKGLYIVNGVKRVMK